MTTDSDPEDDTAIPPVRCKSGRKSAADEAALGAFRVPPMEPLEAGPRGVDIRVRVPSSQTANQYTCVETALAPRTMGPSPHRHEDLDELAFMLEGTLTVLVDDVEYDVPAGGMHLRPRGLVHSFWNATDEPVCFLDMFINQNFDEYLETFFAMREEVARCHSTMTDREFGERMAALDREFGVTQFHEQRGDIVDRYGLTG